MRTTPLYCTSLFAIKITHFLARFDACTIPLGRLSPDFASGNRLFGFSSLLKLRYARPPCTRCGISRIVVTVYGAHSTDSCHRDDKILSTHSGSVRASTQEIIKVALDQTTNIGKYTKTKEKTSNQQPKHNKNVVTGKVETKKQRNTLATEIAIL